MFSFSPGNFNILHRDNFFLLAFYTANSLKTNTHFFFVNKVGHLKLCTCLSWVCEHAVPAPRLWHRGSFQSFKSSQKGHGLSQALGQGSNQALGQDLTLRSNEWILVRRIHADHAGCDTWCQVTPRSQQHGKLSNIAIFLFFWHDKRGHMAQGWVNWH